MRLKESWSSPNAKRRYTRPRRPKLEDRSL
jgi:hypothetical protein